MGQIMWCCFFVLNSSFIRKRGKMFLRLRLNVGIECVELNWTSNAKIQLN
jgi:hypothetical protein